MSSFVTSQGEKIELTKGEHLLIHRLRQGENQQQAAKAWKVNYQQYSAWETGKDTTKVPKVALGRITTAERCVIHRKRSGRSQASVAGDLECCVFTLRKMENGQRDCEDLIAYWET